MNLSVDIGGIKMKNPVMPASGCFGYGEEYSQIEGFDLNQLGAIVTKGTTLEPRAGAPQLRCYETAAGMINRIGLANPGVEVVIKEKLPFLRQFDVPVIVNINGGTTEEYGLMAERLNGVEGVAGLEVNISCPNTEKGGMAFGKDPVVAYQTVRKVRQATSLPLIAKLTPNVTDIVVIARPVVEAGADVVSLINTVEGRAKIRKGPYAGKWIQGGLSGPCIKPIAICMVTKVAEADLGVPIIGMGGIMNVEDAVEFLESGATAIAIGTANFLNPLVMMEVIAGLEEYLRDRGIDDVNQIIGGRTKGG